jgi:hypothetical protein
LWAWSITFGIFFFSYFRWHILYASSTHLSIMWLWAWSQSTSLERHFSNLDVFCTKDLMLFLDWISSWRAWIKHVGNKCRMKINVCTQIVYWITMNKCKVCTCVRLIVKNIFHLFEGTRDVAQKKDRSLWELEHWFVPSCWNSPFSFEFQHAVTKFVHAHETFACWHSCSFQNLSMTMNPNMQITCFLKRANRYPIGPHFSCPYHCHHVHLYPM